MQNSDRYRMTTWHNPLKVVQKCRIYRGPGNNEMFVVPPGEDRQLPSELDAAIQVYNEDGVIVSGQCPLLVRVDGPPMKDLHGKEVDAPAPRLHEALDPMGAEKKSAIERLAEAQLARFAAEQVEANATTKAASAAGNAAEHDESAKAASDKAAAEKARANANRK